VSATGDPDVIAASPPNDARPNDEWPKLIYSSGQPALKS
jgi:hypothetical protein